MKPSHLLCVALVLAIANATWAEPPQMKMTTEVPEGIATPDKLETRIGTLTSIDGVPDKITVQKIYDNLDFHRGVEAFLSGIQVASMSALRKGCLEVGPPNTTVQIFEDLMDSKALWLTPNTTSIYNVTWLELKDEPMVIETPPDVLGHGPHFIFSPPESLPRWRPILSGRAQNTLLPILMPTESHTTAARRTRSTCRRTRPPRTSGPSPSTTTRLAPCYRPTSGSQVSTTTSLA